MRRRISVGEGPARDGGCAEVYRGQARSHMVAGLQCTGHNDQYDHTDLERAMITETSAVKFRQNLGEMLNQVQYRHDSVVINKDGKPVAALIDARLFERIRRMQARFDALSSRIEQGFVGIPEEEGLMEIQQAILDARADR